MPSHVRRRGKLSTVNASANSTPLSRHHPPFWSSTLRRGQYQSLAIRPDDTAAEHELLNVVADVAGCCGILWRRACPAPPALHRLGALWPRMCVETVSLGKVAL